MAVLELLPLPRGGDRCGRHVAIASLFNVGGLFVGPHPAHVGCWNYICRAMASARARSYASACATSSSVRMDARQATPPRATTFSGGSENSSGFLLVFLLGCFWA